MKKLLILVLVLPLVTFGQAFTPRRPFIPTQSSGSPSFLDHIWHYWVAADLTTQAVVTAWNDRYSSLILSNANGAARPSNYTATNGVYFNGSSMFLTNVPAISWVSVPNRCYFYVAKAWQPLNTWAIAVPSDNNSGWNGAFGVFYYFSSRTLHFSGGLGDSTFGNYADGVTMDIEVNSTIVSVDIYTNGVLAGSNSGQPVYNGTVGDVQDLGWFFKGFIMEIGMSTNTFTAQNIIDYHTYATNTYKFTP